MSRPATIHTSRTIMFAELCKVMNHGLEGNDFHNALNLNVANKLSKINLTKTNHYLKKLYSFDHKNISFKAFKHYWRQVDELKKPIITLLYALQNDFLLSQSVELVAKAGVGDKIAVEKFDDNIETRHPGKYSANTRRSTAGNLASSWKQAGYIEGKIKNIRVKPQQDYFTVSFALLLSYLNGERGDFILMSNCVKALGLSNDELRELMKEAAKRDLMQYQYGGNVTTISFERQLKLIE